MMVRKCVCILALASLLLGNAQDDHPPSPQDDFFGHVNAAWLKEAEIPANVPWTGPFVENTLAIQAEVKAIVSDIVARPAYYGPVGINIASYWHSIVAPDVQAGMETLKEDWRRIERVSDKSELVALMCRLHASHSDFDVNNAQPGVTPVWIGSRALPGDASKQAVFVEPAGLGLPSPAYYLEEQHAQARTKYLQLIPDLMGEAGEVMSAAEAQDIMNLEQGLAAARMSEAQRHDASATFTLKRSPLDTGHPFDWASMFEGCGLAVDEWLVADERYFAALADAIDAHPLQTWQLYFKWQLARRYAPFLSEGMRGAHAGFYGGELSGNSEPRAVDEMAALAVDAAFSAEIEQVWLKKHFDASLSQEVRIIAETIRAAFRRRIASSELFSSSAKAQALRKLERLNIQIGHPQEYRSPIAARLSPSNPVANMILLQRASFDADVAEASSPRDRDKWYAPAYDTSAYYVRSTNTLAIPAGMFRAPWFDRDRSAVENFAGLGSIIAHEIAHAFDDQGSQYDAQGVLKNWWEPQDRVRFEAEISKLKRQYSNYEALPGLFLDGELTVSEAFADLAGLVVGREALLDALGELSPARQREITREYLAANCRMKRAVFKEQLLRRIATSESHAPNQQRCNGPISASNSFYDVYAVRASDKMYLAPEDRASIF
ncbi:MAG: M13 family metallopeptidase [Erythrobacter sp.]|jgi:putative endopeptidase|nr:M13 family metallopeptidase [Erythrobacter sp.]